MPGNYVGHGERRQIYETSTLKVYGYLQTFQGLATGG